MALVEKHGSRLLAALCIGALVAGAASAAERTPRWVEVRGPHFTVYSDGNVKQARDVAAQFEEIRGLFQRMWPLARVDPSRPIIILAAKDERSLKSLLPEFWERKGSVHPAGIFVRGEDKNYIALRTDLGDAYKSWDENPYHLVYHEYAHLMLDLNFGSLPAWLNEGLADFYAGTIIGRDEIQQGRPLTSHIIRLRERTHLPLETLLKVDYRSPEYNEASRASVFYAQSWALVHYFLLGEKGAHRPAFGRYVDLLRDGVGEEQAARQALGDLGKLGSALESYVRRVAFYAIRADIVHDAAQAELGFGDVGEAESLAIRGDFHLARGRLQTARPLLEQAVGLAPELASAQASLGLLDLREHRREEAQRRMARAVELDSKSFLIHYLHATMNMGPQETRESLAAVEESLRRATALNHDFAPAYALLAEVAAYRSGDYAGALPLARRAVALEPGVGRHRLSVGRLLSAMGKYDEASLEGTRALAAGRSEAERQAAQQFLATLVRPSPPPVDTTRSADVVGEPVPGAGSFPKRVAEVAGNNGARVVSTKGVIVSMRCRPAGELLFAVETAAGRLSLRADAPDRVLLHKGGAWIQMDWQCGALRIPVSVKYQPRKGAQDGTGVDGTIVSFDLDPAP